MEERKIKIIEIDELFIYMAPDQKDWHIDDFIDWLNKVKQNGATNICFGGSADYDGIVEEVFLNCYYTRPETDEEYNNRLEVLAEKRAEKEQEQLKKDKELYEKLKQKFENQ